MKRSEPDAELLCVALSLSPNVGAKTLDNLLRHFNRDVDAILAASPQELQQVRGIGKAIAREIREIDLNRIAEALSAWRARGLHILTRMDPAYPETPE